MESSEYIFQPQVHVDPLLKAFVIQNSPAEYNYPPNWHENIEFLYCVSGTGSLRYNEKMYALKEGDLIIVNSEMFHYIYSDTPMYFHCLIPDRRFCKASGIPTSELRFQEQIRDPDAVNAFLQIFDAYNRFLQNGCTYDVASFHARILDFLHLLCEKYLIHNNSVPPHRNELVKATMVYIEQHLTQPMTLDAIAAHVGVDKYHLTKEFKRVIGRTIFDTILMLRCAEAKRQLQNGTSVAQAARTCGFENMSYFTRAFKKYQNALPSSYLQK